jgi:hypothetical protein
MTKPQSQGKDHSMRRLGDKDLSTLPLRILFHINEFRNGGTETSLMSWLRTLDRRYFIPCRVVTYPTQELEAWKTLAIPADVPVHVLAASARMHALHQAYRAGAFGVGAKLLYNLLTYGVIVHSSRGAFGVSLRHTIWPATTISRCGISLAIQQCRGLL